MKDKNNGYTIFETFVGAGGSHIGFIQENFRTIYVNDIEKDCLDTLLYNNKNIIKEKAYVDNRSILDINPKKLREELGVKTGEIDVFFGGVVCKGFSLAGERNPHDKRNYFYKKQLDFVNEFRPKISIIENVPAILNSKVLSDDAPDEIKQKVTKLWKQLENYKGLKASLRKSNNLSEEVKQQGINLRLQKKEIVSIIKRYLISVVDDIKNIYKNLGYNVNYEILNSALYGSATKRERIIIVAVRNDIGYDFVFPKPLFMDEVYFKKGMDKSLLNLPKPLTVDNALSKIDYSNKFDIDNIPMKHALKTIERFKYIPEGDNIANHIDELPENLKISKFYSRGSTMRLNGSKPSPTLVPGHSNFPVHPKQNRCITVREASTITGFPIDYKFIGSHLLLCEHVGNAVPPPLARAIAKECNNLLDKYYGKKY